MNVNEFAKEVHANAVSHGWWDDSRPNGEVLALIHSEWSEALEEARAGRPGVWYSIYDKDDDCGGGGRCDAVVESGVCHGRNGECELHHKPEGIFVELADGCIRILVFLTHVECGLNVDNNDLEKLCEGVPDAERHLTLSECVARLHWHVSIAYSLPADSAKGMSRDNIVHTKVAHLYMALAVACVWINENGGDAEKIMLEKHAYNKTRSYKHGKRF